MTVQSLRKNKVKVRVQHYRYNNLTPDRPLPQKEVPGPLRATKGGATVVEVTLPNGRGYNASADCSSADGFSRRFGLNLALNRIKNQMREDKRGGNQ